MFNIKSLLSLGAINRRTGQYTTPFRASKQEKYICPEKDCGKDVIFRNGTINKPHFSHHLSVGCKQNRKLVDTDMLSFNR